LIRQDGWSIEGVEYKLYWSSNSNLTSTASGNTIVGVAAEAAASCYANVKLLLNVGL
jgi:predicted RecA/RadA family phage recombinase